MNRQPLDRSFNAAILHIASKLFPLGFDVEGVDTDECAPFSAETLCQRLDAGGRMVVSSVGCDQTIYECKETNYAFRAWHDWTHWRYGTGFDLEGERATVEHQIADLRKLYGVNGRWEEILRAEVIGQADYFADHGEFPTDQRAFVEGWLYVGGFHS